MISQFKNKLLTGESSSNSIAGAAFLIAAMGLASRALGFVRDRVIVSNFSAGDVTDAYYAAFRIPDLVFNLLVVGALSAAFVPVFTSLLSREKKEEAWALANGVISIGIIAVSAIAAVLLVFTGQLVDLITFGFSDEKKSLVVDLTRIMLASPIILGISGIVGGILNSHKKFFFYSLAPIFYNLGIIFGAAFLTDWWGPKGLAAGVVLGALLHLSIQLPEVRRCGFRYRCYLDFKNPDLKKVGKLMIPRTMGLAVSQLNLLIVTILASTLASGSLTIFNLANNVQSVPLGLFGISFSIAAFPTLSSLWAQDKKEEFIKSFSKTFRQIMFFVIPFSVIFIVLRAQIVRVAFGTGKFDWEDTTLTFNALAIFSMSLFAQCAIPLLARSFYALQNTRIPFVVGLISEAINLWLAIMLIRHYEILGLVWAFSISAIINMLLLFIILFKKLGGIGEQQIVRSVWKIMFATLGMAMMIQALKWVIHFAVDMDTFLGVFLQLAGSLLGGLAVFVAIGKLLRIHELEQFIRVIRNKVFKPKMMLDEERDEVSGI